MTQHGDENLYYPSVHARLRPDHPAQIMAATGEVLTYRELDKRSMQIAQRLRGAGLGPGDGVAFYLENHPWFLALGWGAHRAALRFTAINYHLNADEVEYIVRDCGARAFITSRAQSEAALQLAERFDDLERLALVGPDGPSLDGYKDLEREVAALPAQPVEDEGEGVSMLYSSGTTGRPKGVYRELTRAPLGTPPPNLDLTLERYQVSEDSIYLSPAPLYHAAPLAFNMLFQRMGATCVIMERFDAATALRHLDEYRITHSQWVPTMFVRMLKLPADERAGRDLSQHRCAIHAAAPCPVPVKKQMIEWWGPILKEYYAGTEGNGSTFVDSHEWLAHPGTVGKPQGVTIHITDDEGRELPVGESGAIWFDGGAEFEYHNDPDKTAASRHPKGWSTLGDIGYVDEEGYLYLTDRKAHMIIRGGVNVYPQEAENVLITHPEVFDCAVIGVPHDDLGEEVKGVVQLMPGVSPRDGLEEELLEYCRQSLARFKCPASIDFEDELPRHPTGKLYKRLLRDRYRGATDLRIVETPGPQSV